MSSKVVSILFIAASYWTRLILKQGQNEQFGTAFFPLVVHSGGHICRSHISIRRLRREISLGITFWCASKILCILQPMPEGGHSHTRKTGALTCSIDRGAMRRLM